MSVGRVLGILVLIVVLYAVITQPTQSAATTREGMGHLADAGSSMTQFMSALGDGDGSATASDGSTTSGGGSTTSSDGVDTTSNTQVDETPSGGVDAGDGSTER